MYTFQMNDHDGNDIGLIRTNALEADILKYWKTDILEEDEPIEKLCELLVAEDFEAERFFIDDFIFPEENL